ncbi:putative F-box and FNIP repeat-containing protein [Megavirus lba]|uniref:Putative F-box and FNIP repeat-containing protein n=1 Tax=Megavirus lba TaxID=1235314 RepID=L7Y664_9VIRU|nr:putative F-box and FNIP repeat-containing protein [Megavirus lba]
MFNDDVIMNIMNYLSDRDKIIFASINHNMRFFLDKSYYTELHNYEYVKKLDYVERFKRVSYKISNGSNILIPNIVTDLIIKCGYYNNLIIPTHIIHITVCDCMCSKMKYIIDQRIKITINNQLSKCNNFPRYDKRFDGALTLLAANSYQDPYITIDTDKPKILLKNKYNCSRNHNQYFKNTNKYNKRIQKYNY